MTHHVPAPAATVADVGGSGEDRTRPEQGVTPAPRRAVTAWVPAAAMVIVLAPLVVLFARALGSGLPDFAVDGDMAVTELAVREAAAGRRLSGPYSRFAFSHPGPLPFYLMAPGYRLAGDSFSGMLVSALLLNAACVACALVIVWLAAGRLAATWAASAMALYLLYLRPELLHSVWNPNLSLLPFAVAVLAAAAGSGWRWAAPIGVLAASLALQCHVAYLLPLLAVIGVVAVLRLATIIGGREAAGASTSRGPRGTWVVATALTLALWSPVIIEQAGGRPGNLTRLARFFAGAGTGQAVPAAAGVVAATVGSVVLAPIGASAAISAAAAPRAAQLAAALLLGGAAAAFLRCRRRRDQFGAALALSCIVLFAVAVVAVTRIVGSVEPYLVRWISVLAPLTVLAIFLAFARPGTRVGRTWAAWLGLGLALALSSVNLARAFVFAPLGVHAAAERYRRIDRLAAVAAARLDREGLGSPRIGVFSHAVWDTAAGVGLRLLKLGYAVGVDPAWHDMMGRAAAVPGWRADSALVVCTPASAAQFTAGGAAAECGGDEHVALLLVVRPETVEEVAMASPLSVLVCSEGLYGPEAGRFRWSRGLSSTFAVPLMAGRPYDLEIAATPAGAPKGSQDLGVSLNGMKVGELVMRSGASRYRLRLPASAIGHDNDLRFEYRYFVVPGVGDPRELAVRFEALRFTPLDGGSESGGAGRPVGD